MSALLEELRQDFQTNEKEYRHAYADENLNATIATQIKVLREQREWRQEDLAREAEMTQPMISRYENVNYSSWSINTLKKFACAYDVWLDVRFRPFGELVTTTDEFGRKSLQVPKFDDDPFFKEAPAVAASADESKVSEEIPKRFENIVNIDGVRKALANGRPNVGPQRTVSTTEQQEGRLAYAACGSNSR